MGIDMNDKIQPCCTIKAHHSEEIKQKLSNRLKRIEGQVKGVRRMIDDDTYCDHVLNQIVAIQKALNGVAKQLMSEHIKSCVTEQLISGKSGVVDELLANLSKMMH